MDLKENAAVNPNPFLIFLDLADASTHSWGSSPHSASSKRKYSDDEETVQSKKKKRVRSTPRQWLVVKEGLTRTQCAPYMKCHRWKEPVTNAPKGAGCRVSQCVLHAGCTHLIKMRLTSNDVVDLYTIEEHGQHSTEVVNSTQGLNDIILDEVDALLLRGMTPSDALTALQQRYTAEGNWTLLSLLPSDASKIRNRMFTLAKKAAKLDGLRDVASASFSSSSTTTASTKEEVPQQQIVPMFGAADTLAELTQIFTQSLMQPI